LRSFESETAEIWIVECINIPIEISYFWLGSNWFEQTQKYLRDFVWGNTEL
jgi:hypothetical protein